MIARIRLTRLFLLLFTFLPIGSFSSDVATMAADAKDEKKIVRRAIPLEEKYLLIPIQNGAPSVAVDFEIDGEPVRQFDCELAASAEDADFWAFLDLTPFGDKTATLRARGATEEQLASLRQAATIPGDDASGDSAFYRESLRPQFHFSQL